MPRTEARISVEIWDDPHFLSLSPLAQRLYLFLTSQREITHVGVLPLRERRWATKCSGMTATQISEHLDELALERFVVVDEVEGEVLIRSLMRRDKVYRQPQVMRAAADQLAMVVSSTLRAAIGDELRRIAQVKGLHADSAQTVAAMLEAIGDPAGTLPAGSEKGPRPNRMERGVVTAVSRDSPFPYPQAPIPHPETSEPGPPTAPKQRREDVERICTRLADKMIENGCRPPNITERWRTEARLLLDRDQRPIDDVIKVIDWCQQDTFWKANIQSMLKFREKYDSLRLALERQASSNGRGGYNHRPYLNPALADQAAAYDVSKL